MQLLLLSVLVAIVKATVDCPTCGPSPVGLCNMRRYFPVRITGLSDGLPEPALSQVTSQVPLTHATEPIGVWGSPEPSVPITRRQVEEMYGKTEAQMMAEINDFIANLIPLHFPGVDLSGRVPVPVAGGQDSYVWIERPFDQFPRWLLMAGWHDGSFNTRPVLAQGSSDAVWPGDCGRWDKNGLFFVFLSDWTETVNGQSVTYKARERTSQGWYKIWDFDWRNPIVEIHFKLKKPDGNEATYTIDSPYAVEVAGIPGGRIVGPMTYWSELEHPCFGIGTGLETVMRDFNLIGTPDNRVDDVLILHYTNFDLLFPSMGAMSCAEANFAQTVNRGMGDQSGAMGLGGATGDKKDDDDDSKDCGCASTQYNVAFNN